MPKGGGTLFSEGNRQARGAERFCFLKGATRARWKVLERASERGEREVVSPHTFLENVSTFSEKRSKKKESGSQYIARRGKKMTKKRRGGDPF